VKHARIWLIAVLALAGCSKNIDNKDAVAASVKKYVAGKGINVDQMNVNVNTVSFHGNQADAQVAFVPKGGGSGVSANYQLERVKDEWVVKSRSTMNTLDHTRGMPGAETVPGQQLPPGHGNPDGTLGSKP
jgi:hypothetical protein